MKVIAGLLSFSVGCLVGACCANVGVPLPATILILAGLGFAIGAACIIGRD